MNRIALALTALIASCSAHAGPLETITSGALNFSMGVDQATGKVNRCGVELRAYEATGDTSKPPSMLSVSMHGVIGSVYLMTNEKGGVYASSKMAMYTKPFGKKELDIQPINNWWMKAGTEPAAVITSKIIDADNKPYKIAGMKTDAAIGLLVSFMAKLPVTYYFEPTKQGGANNFTATSEMDGGDKDKLNACLKEMLQ